MGKIAVLVDLVGLVGLRGLRVLQSPQSEIWDPKAMQGGCLLFTCMARSLCRELYVAPQAA